MIDIKKQDGLLASLMKIGCDVRTQQQKGILHKLNHKKNTKIEQKNNYYINLKRKNVYCRNKMQEK